MRIDVILLRAGPSSRVTDDSRLENIEIRVVDASVFDALSTVERAQGIIAVISMDALPEPQALGPTSLVLIVDRLRDPGNLGTLLRSAAAGGVSEVMLTPTSVDPLNPKCVRASMGALWRLPVASRTFADISRRIQDVATVALADALGDTMYTDVDWSGPSVIIVGGEAEGAAAASAAMATLTVRIPLVAGIESLNAGVAGSLLIFEAARQRRQA